MARRTKEDAEKTREAIIDAAERVFYARGVTRASLEQVADAAGVTRGAVYWYFKNKAALCNAMADRIFLPHEDVLEKLATQPSANPIDDLRKACLHALKMMAKDKRRRDVAAILLLRCEYVESEMLTIMKRRNESRDRLRALSEKLFERAVELDLLAKGWTPRTAALSVLTFMSGLVLEGLEQCRGPGFASDSIPCVEAFFASLKAN